jgi:hypothetical protein
VNTTTDNISYGVTAALTNVMVFIPRLLACLAILLIGFMVAKAVSKLVDKLLHKVGFGRILERAGFNPAMSNAGYDLGNIIGMVCYYAILLLAFQLAFAVFGPNPISDVLNRMIAFLPNVFVATGIVVLAAFVGKAVKDIVAASLGGLSYGRTLANVASMAIVVLGVFMALSQLNIAPYIVNGLFYAMLAIIVGSAVVAIGGGGIVPMRQVWENTMTRVAAEAPRVQSELQAANLRLEQVSQEEPTTGANIYERRSA